MQIKILSFNIWDIPFWFSPRRHERAHRLGEYLKKIDPDIICLQEAFDVKHRESIHQVLGKDKYYVTESNGETRRVLLFKRFDLTGGLVIFSKLPILKSKFVHFRRFVDMMFAEYIGRKGVLEMTVETSKGPLVIMNTHFHAGKFSIDRKVRIRQLNRLFKAVKSISKKNPIIIAGDLNEHDIMNQEECSEIIKKAGFHDGADYSRNPKQPTVRVENPYSRTWPNQATPYSQRLDYILFRNLEESGFKIQNQEVLKQPESSLSDHDPVLLTISTEE